MQPADSGASPLAEELDRPSEGAGCAASPRVTVARARDATSGSSSTDTTAQWESHSTADAPCERRRLPRCSSFEAMDLPLGPGALLQYHSHLSYYPGCALVVRNDVIEDGTQFLQIELI